jgi:hypothetical protein
MYALLLYTVAHKLYCSFILSFTQHTNAPGLFPHVLQQQQQQQQQQQ